MVIEILQKDVDCLSDRNPIWGAKAVSLVQPSSDEKNGLNETLTVSGLGDLQLGFGPRAAIWQTSLMSLRQAEQPVYLHHEILGAQNMSVGLNRRLAALEASLAPGGKTVAIWAMNPNGEPMTEQEIGTEIAAFRKAGAPADTRFIPIQWQTV